MRKQTKYFINGVILVILALLSITIVPLIVEKLGFYAIEKYIYAEIEFFLLIASASFWLFCPFYYRAQLLSILFALIYYFVFSKLYRILF